MGVVTEKGMDRARYWQIGRRPTMLRVGLHPNEMARVTMSVIRHGANVRGRAASSRAGGVVRRVDELGRIVIPVEIRRRFGIDVRDPLEISVRGETIVLS